MDKERAPWALAESQMFCISLPANFALKTTRQSIWVKLPIICKEEAESFMYKHQKDRHHGTEANFTAKVKASFKDCLSRQVAEGVHIRRCEKELLNSKSEWHQPALWKVRTELSRE